MEHVFLPISLLTSGIVAGVLLGGGIGVVPLFRALPAPQYVHAHSFVVGRYDPFQPLCLLVAAIGDVVLAISTRVAAAQAFCIIGALAAVAVSTVSRARTAPMGRWVKTLDPGDLPRDWNMEDFRRRWGHWNRLRTGFAILVLLSNVAAASVLL
jgi:hypothetical protein